MNKSQINIPSKRTISPTKKSSQLLYNSRIINTYIKLIKRNYSYVNLDKLLSYAKMESHQVEDEGHWFNQEQIDLFYEKVEKLTGNRNIAREAGRYSASPEAIGVMRPYILGLVGPSKAYELVGKYASNFTRSSVYKSKNIGSGQVEITVLPIKGIKERQFQCENRIGSFESIALMFNSNPIIYHTECMFKGGNVCRYIVSWKKSRWEFWKKIRNYTIFIFLVALVGSYRIFPEITLSFILPALLIITIMISIYAGRLEKQELRAAIENLRGSGDKLVEQINVNYNNALMINEIGLALTKQTNINSILSEITRILENRLDYDRGIILLANQDRTRLVFRAGFGYDRKQLKILRNTGFHLDRSESKGVFVISFRNQKPFLINNIDEIKDTLTARTMEFARKMNVKSFICCPIIYEDESIGILAVDNLRTKRPLQQSDMNLLMGIAPEIGISINTALLVEEKEYQFKSIIKVLAASIDARDFLTAGHSEQVAEYAVGICRKMGLPENYCEMIRIASLLHDYGKIGIEDSILKKDRKLSAEEYEEIKSHATKSKEILEQVNFEGIYSEIPAIAGHHHEKINGSGYPIGLKGRDIPFGARVIAVADFFEAVTSKRHYREPIPAEEAINLLIDTRGIHFDDDIVEAFISYYNEQSKGKENKK